MKQRIFPKDFLWGASTAAHQVEGDNHNQWTVWENHTAGTQAVTAKQRYGHLANWGSIQAQAESADNYISGNGVEHYSRYKTDFALLKRLNMNAFRFSIEWSRIEPEEGVWDKNEIEHYKEYLAELKRQGIEPVVTLWHWTVPVWFSKKGEFEKRRNVRYFVRFVTKVTEELGNEFQYVTLLNEPNVHASESYLRGTRPPGRKSPFMTLRVYHNLVVAHRQAYAALKQAGPHLKVGIAFAISDIRPARPHNMCDRLVAGLASYAANWWYLDRIHARLDFIGVNYYFTSYIAWNGKLQNPSQPASDLGWYMEPARLQQVLRAVWRRYRLPIIVTENGLADTADVRRKWWLEQTIKALEAAIKSGVELRGYLHWSLLDNFEWEQGYWPRFGLVAVDRKTMRRRIRPSATWFAAEIKRLCT